MRYRYYIVQAHLHPDLRESSFDHGLTFVRVSQNELEHIAGDSTIISLLEFTDCQLRISSRALCKYSIFPMGKKQFDTSKEHYLKRIREEQNTRRIHSAR